MDYLLVYIKQFEDFCINALASVSCHAFPIICAIVFKTKAMPSSSGGLWWGKKNAGLNYHEQQLLTYSGTPEAAQEPPVFCPIKFAHKQEVSGPKSEGMEIKISGKEAWEES